MRPGALLGGLHGQDVRNGNRSKAPVENLIHGSQFFTNKIPVGKWKDELSDYL